MRSCLLPLLHDIKDLEHDPSSWYLRLCLVTPAVFCQEPGCRHKEGQGCLSEKSKAMVSSLQDGSTRRHLVGYSSRGINAPSTEGHYPRRKGTIPLCIAGHCGLVWQVWEGEMPGLVSHP